MGHYRSEMGLEDQDRRDEERRAKRRAKAIATIKADIKKRGIEEVLTDIVLDAQLYRIQFL